jgi:uncharacterized protein YeeX (DUF496 family)
MLLNELTTQADQFYTELEDEGTIQDGAKLLTFLDNLVDYLEMNGGRVEGMEYIREKEEVMA